MVRWALTHSELCSDFKQRSYFTAELGFQEETGGIARARSRGASLPFTDTHVSDSRRELAGCYHTSTHTRDR